MNGIVEREGVIKFDCRHRLGAPLAPEHLLELNAWRKILFQLALIGQDPARYAGLGFGNLSRRAPHSLGGEGGAFIISGTQTGGIPDLDASHYTLVRHCDPQTNRVEAEGPIAPSSESLTHGVLYALDARVNAVMHVHSPHLWGQAEPLGLPLTRSDVAYGTPDMAAEVARLWRQSPVRELGIFAMGGHEDGIVAFARTCAEAGATLIRRLAQAYQFTSPI
ncbi:class II aldolase/adducin family protein [Geoalkalibacter sp.]|uniref:class II aldolase/adducin family protein n=1 Tax=Geoalkalibacter sp. TaxID=3041440 RepID=UPI00272E89D5|nr:class II aldolase/adducin family protein [Geoalkalibacter sp.]